MYLPKVQQRILEGLLKELQEGRPAMLAAFAIRAPLTLVSLRFFGLWSKEQELLLHLSRLLWKLPDVILV